MIKISVITPTIRLEGIPIVLKALAKQTFRDYEWKICSPYITNKEFLTMKENHNIPHIEWIQDDFQGGFWGLNRSYNLLFKKAQGELIVSWQDWITAKPDALQKFWDAYKQTSGIISGVGDQYESLDKFGKPQIKIWSDPRKTEKYGSFYECFPQDAEWNFCAIPKEAIYSVGGMDEELDFLGYGGDQLQICARMNDIGCRFYLDQTNESYTIRHSRDDFGGQKKWDENHVLFNGEYEKRIKELKSKGEWPCINYI